MIGNIVNNMKQATKDLIQRLRIRLGLEEEFIETPKEWATPEQEQEEGAPMDWLFEESSLAVEPVYVFPKDRKKWTMRIPWFKKAKRVMAFILIVFSILGMVGSTFDTTYILYFLPVTGILIDYLLKTQPKKQSKWYVLDDLEEQ